MASGELEFEAPLACFDIDEWTDLHDSNEDEVMKTDFLHRSDDIAESVHVDSCDGSSSGSCHLAENFGETVSGSLEDLVNTFDERVTKCCKNYDEKVEHVAPVQTRTASDIDNESCQTWYTLTGTFGSLLPINWSHNYLLKSQTRTLSHVTSNGSKQQSPFEDEDDEDDEELFLAVDESDVHGDFDEITSTKVLSKLDEDEESLDGFDNPDEVIRELEALMEDQVLLEHGCDSLRSSPPPLVDGKLSPYDDDTGLWFEESIQKLSVGALQQLAEELARAVTDYSTSLQHELKLNEQLSCENQLSRNFIALTLDVQRKQQLLDRLRCHHDDEADDGISDRSAWAGTYLSTVIPYRPCEGRPSVERLQLYLTLLSAIDEDSPSVPALLTDYILKVLCPAN